MSTHTDQYTTHGSIGAQAAACRQLVVNAQCAVVLYVRLLWVLLLIWLLHMMTCATGRLTYGQLVCMCMYQA